MTLANIRNARPRIVRASSGSTRLLRIAILVYGILSYAIVVATFLYGIGFVGDLLVPTSLAIRSIDAPHESTQREAIVSDVALLALFAAQHSLMARKWFRRASKAVLPEAAEGSTYMLLSSICMGLVFWGWKPFGGTIWQVADTAGRVVPFVFFWAGWGIVLISTFQASRFDDFGLHQVWMRFRNQKYVRPRFRCRGLYRFVRHPVYLGCLFAFWFTPHMTAGHLLFSAFSTAYILIAIDVDEKDLIERYGEAYLKYREEVPMLVPSLLRPRETIV